MVWRTHTRPPRRGKVCAEEPRPTGAARPQRAQAGRHRQRLVGASRKAPGGHGRYSVHVPRDLGLRPPHRVAGHRATAHGGGASRPAAVASARLPNQSAGRDAPDSGFGAPGWWHGPGHDAMRVAAPHLAQRPCHGSQLQRDAGAWARRRPPSAAPSACGETSVRHVSKSAKLGPCGPSGSFPSVWSGTAQACGLSGADPIPPWWVPAALRAADFRIWGVGTWSEVGLYSRSPSRMRRWQPIPQRGGGDGFEAGRAASYLSYAHRSRPDSSRDRLVHAKPFLAPTTTLNHK